MDGLLKKTQRNIGDAMTATTATPQCFTSNFKGRFVVSGQRVRVYRNLNNGKFSVLAMEGDSKGLVVAHFDSLSVKPLHSDASMVKILKSGQLRARQHQVRNVHCFIEALFVDDLQPEKPLSKEITYNPFNNDSFVFKKTGAQWNGKGSSVSMLNGKAYVD